ncbi:MAG: peptidoglycan-binding protein, partial [Alphaproteobacteria bacterium]|nr:peptidoglycan-binding protein [Alphaproteobacteria bacterium]
SRLQPTPDVDNETDNSVAPAYTATSVVASVPTPAPSSQVGMSKEQAKADNKAIQRMLRVLGYKVDRVDGEYGPQTAAAIRGYQRDHSVYPDGEPTAELINALMRDVRGQ